MASGRTALVPRVRLSHAHHGHDRARQCSSPEHTEVLPEGLGDNVRLNAPELAALRHVTSYLSEAHVVEANPALPGAAHVVACVVAAADVRVVSEKGTHGGAAGFRQMPVNHSPTRRRRIHHRCWSTGGRQLVATSVIGHAVGGRTQISMRKRADRLVFRPR